mmetsp:Transcript_47500/g.115772  ORF Transcript_47500/g.115772 Transcript_47500/m.115772 type:complete len:235 (+) Transcript_47500:148-852(+)|eukprot:CAMPEP_0113464002 /NCGR_PEP_ID=MMETSP0014_2-20120614/12964_1 /TAXON_ID=2857 /ORGANISM="Nitzschia sp." /LENGTH=234 /DNA_ID=CAMNT_0000356045 /DNA_START=85 /DNA_END=789 /DNA_ORIENTATION=+ /assembly_acc=CAM_ASM_000159
MNERFGGLSAGKGSIKGNRTKVKNVKNKPKATLLVRSVVTVFLLGLVPVVVDVFLEQRVRIDVLSSQIGSDVGTERTAEVDSYLSQAKNEAKQNKQSSPQHQHQAPLPELKTTFQTTVPNKTSPTVSPTIQNEDKPNPVTQTTSVPSSSTTTRNITSVRVNVHTPVLYSQENTLPPKRKLRFYLLKIPFLTTDLMENQTHYERARRWAVKPILHVPSFTVLEHALTQSSFQECH